MERERETDLQNSWTQWDRQRKLKKNTENNSECFFFALVAPFVYFYVEVLTILQLRTTTSYYDSFTLTFQWKMFEPLFCLVSLNSDCIVSLWSTCIPFNTWGISLFCVKRNKLDRFFGLACPIYLGWLFKTVLLFYHLDRFMVTLGF